MVLLVDVGNSNIVLGFSDGTKINKTFRIKTFNEKTSDEYYMLLKPLLDNLNIKDVLISSVVPIVTSALKKAFERMFNLEPLIIGPGIKTGIQLKVDDPKTVGADMICDCAGVKDLVKEAIIIDLGTATKYIHYKNNCYLGCSIAPGVSVSMKALVSNAALLPSVELQCPKKIISTSTITCIQSGVIYGSAAMVDGMIERIKKEIDSPNISVFATGGLSKIIVPVCNNKIETVENLTLEGMLKIYHLNK